MAFAGRAVLEGPDHEDRDDDPQHEGSAVADEHLRALAVDVVQEEGDKRAPTETAARVAIEVSPARWKSHPNMTQAMMQ